MTISRYGVRDRKVGRKKPLMHITAVGACIVAEPYWMTDALAMSREEAEQLIGAMGFDGDLYEVFALKDEGK